jgi:hypothetical protein
MDVGPAGEEDVFAAGVSTTRPGQSAARSRFACSTSSVFR